MVDLYKAALDHSVDGVLISDPSGKVIYVNRHYELITGIKQKDILNKNLADLEAQGMFSKAISLEVIRTRMPQSTLHRYFSGKTALTNATPIFVDGEFLGVMNNTRNVDKLVELEHSLEKSIEDSKQLTLEMASLRQLLNIRYDFVCESETMAKTVKEAQLAAPYDTTVLIQGESGTGKEVIARYIHNSSPRKNQAFIRVNCAAIPRELFESELFGYEEGAFTGAKGEGKVGMFELADKGTLLLDEVGELPLDVQSKLLRVIQEKEIRRLGGRKAIPVDVRILSSTNRNLSNEVEEGHFREDLYYRLSVFPVTIAPLRERTRDIGPLIRHFLSRLNRKYKTTKTIEQNAFMALQGYTYPGNVRELENIIEYLYILSDEKITIETIPGKVLSNVMMNTLNNPEFTVKKDLHELMDLYEKSVIEDAIKQHKTLESAGFILGIHASTLSRKMKKYNLSF